MGWSYQQFKNTLVNYSGLHGPSLHMNMGTIVCLTPAPHIVRNTCLTTTSAAETETSALLLFK